MSYDTREIKELCDPLTIVESLGLVCGKQHAGSDSIVIKCPNPNHTDKNPSCRVSRKNKIFHCFSCHAKGDIIELVKMATGNRDHGKALEYIAGVCGLPETTPQKAKANRLAFVLNAEEQEFVGIHEIDAEVNEKGRYIDRDAEDCVSTKHIKLLQQFIRDDPESAKHMVLEKLNERMKELLRENIVLQNRMLDYYFRRSSNVLTQEDEDYLAFDKMNLRDNLAAITFARGIYKKIGEVAPTTENILMDGLLHQNRKIRWDLYFANCNEEDTIDHQVNLFLNLEALETVREIYGLK